MSALSGVFLHGLSQGLGLRKWKWKCCSCFLFGILMTVISDLNFVSFWICTASPPCVVMEWKQSESTPLCCHGFYELFVSPLLIMPLGLLSNSSSTISHALRLIYSWSHFFCQAWQNQDGSRNDAAHFSPFNLSPACTFDHAQSQPFLSAPPLPAFSS